MKDEYSTLRAAFHAGARIQAWTLREFAKSSNDGYWRLLGDNQTHEEPKFSCEPHLYRVYPEDRHLIAELGQEVGAVAWRRPDVYGTGWVYYTTKPDHPQAEPLYTSPAHTSEARDSEVKAMDVLSLAELVDAAVCLESCEAAWCGDEMELAAPRRRLAKAYSGLRKTLFIAQDALECALRNSKRGSRTNAACSTALEYLRRATKQSDDEAMRQEG